LPNPTVSESEPRSERYWRYSSSSCSVSPRELDEDALIAARWTLAPLEAQDACGPYIPPARSERRVLVSGRVRPPGGPDKKVSYAACQLSSESQRHRLTPIGRCLVVVESGMTVLRVSEVTIEDRNYPPLGH
jgi:hypothetical protein